MRLESGIACHALLFVRNAPIMCAVCKVCAFRICIPFKVISAISWLLLVGSASYACRWKALHLYFFLISICINNRILVQTMRIPYIQARKTCFPHISTPINRFSFICMSLETHLSVLTAFLKPRQAGSFSRGIYSILQNDFRRKLHCLVLF